MARLMVVSRSMALAMRIADDHDVVEFPVERLEELTPREDVEAVVLDLGEPAAAMQTLDRLRERGFDTRVLIVSGYQPAWNELVNLQIDRVVVVPLPITRAALLDGIDRLLGNAPDTPRQAPPATASKAPSPPAGRPQPARSLGPPSPPGRPSAPPSAPHPGAPSGRPSRPPAATPDADRARPPAAEGAPPGDRAGTPQRMVDLLTPPRGEPAPAPPVGRSEQGRSEQNRGEQGGAHRVGAHGRAQGAEEPEPGKHRQGLFRLLPNGAQRHTPPAGTPAQRGRLPGDPASAGAADARGATAPPAEEQDFRPVVPPALPSRPASTRPRTPGSPAPPPAPATPAPSGRTAPGGPAAPAGRQTGAPAPAGPARAAQPPAGGHRDRRNDRHPGFTPAHGLSKADLERPSDVQGWVRALLDRRSELFGVAETAQVLADEVIERGESDAAAVLVPDGSQWRVNGGVGLRPLERRLLLEATHWLIAEIAVGGRALLIEDTDIVRPRLAGAPLAAWRHLLAVPVPGIRAAVVLARSQEAARFTERDLAAVVPVIAEAGPLLLAALQMRELARVLAPLRDVDAER
ncbi:MAG: hypothetical protein ACXV3A_07160 [Kineosporiaceae bacterium]